MVNATPDELWEMLRDDVSLGFIRSRNRAIIEISRLDFDDLYNFLRMPVQYQTQKVDQFINSCFLPIDLIRVLMYAELEYKRYISHSNGEIRYASIHAIRDRLLGTDAGQPNT